MKRVKKAWRQMPPVRVLEAIGIFRDGAQETLDTDGQCPNEGRGLRGTRRVYESEAYATIRT